MNNTIEAYRKRRMDRLKSRGANCDEIDWITVENGEHVPVENGKSVGGWSKGRDFSRAKFTKSVAKGTETSAQKVSRGLKKVKSKEDAQKFLKNLNVGDKVHMVLGNRVITYEKASKSEDPYYDRWRCVGGEPYFSPHPGKAFAESKNISTEYFDSLVAEHKCFGSLAAAKKEVSKTFPSKTDAGRLEKVATLATMPSTGKLYQQLKADKHIGGSEMGTETYAIYKKSISNTKELNDHIEQIQPNVRLKRALNEMGVDGFVYESRKEDMAITRDAKGNAYVTVQFKESHGRGKKATFRKETYKINAYATKRSYVNSNGDVVVSDIDNYDIRYKLTPVSKEKAA